MEHSGLAFVLVIAPSTAAVGPFPPWPVWVVAVVLASGYAYFQSWRRRR